MIRALLKITLSSFLSFLHLITAMLPPSSADHASLLSSATYSAFPFPLYFQLHKGISEMT